MGKLLNKAWILTLLIAMLFVVPITAQAEITGVYGTNLSWTLDDEGTLTISGTGAMINYGTSRDVPWHDNRMDICAVVVTDGVTSIGNHAFNGCSRLTSVTFSDSVTSICYAAFNDCTSLTSVSIPKTITKIGDSAFSGCTNLRNITLPESIASIGFSMFLVAAV